MFTFIPKSIILILAYIVGTFMARHHNTARTKNPKLKPHINQKDASIVLIPHDSDIDPTTFIHPTATIGQNVTIGEYVFVNKNADIGDCVYIGHSTILGAFVTIEPLTRIGENSEIYDSATIGKEVTIEGGGHIGEKVTIKDRICIGKGSRIKKGAQIESGIPLPVNISMLSQISLNSTGTAEQLPIHSHTGKGEVHITFLSDGTKIPAGHIVENGEAITPSLQAILGDETAEVTAQ